MFRELGHNEEWLGIAKETFKDEPSWTSLATGQRKAVTNTAPSFVCLKCTILPRRNTDRYGKRRMKKIRQGRSEMAVNQAVYSNSGGLEDSRDKYWEVFEEDKKKLSLKTAAHSCHAVDNVHNFYLCRVNFFTT
jgi:hypothetical protein